MYPDGETVEPESNLRPGLLIVERLECCKVEMLRREAITIFILKTLKQPYNISTLQHYNRP